MRRRFRSSGFGLDEVLLSLLNLLNLLNYGLGEFLGVSAWGLFFCVVVGGSLSTRQSWVLGACGLCGLCGLTVGCGPSALRWMAARAEFVGV